MLQRSYARLGYRYLLLCFAFEILITIIGGALIGLVLFGLLGGSVHDWGFIVGMTEAVVLTVSLPGSILLRRRAAPLFEWLRNGRPRELAELAWRAAVGLTTRIDWPLIPLTAVASLVAVIYIAQHFHLSAGTVPIIWMGAILSGAGWLVIVIFTLTVLLGPIVRDAAREVPADQELDGPRIGVQFKLLVALALTTACTVMTVNAIIGVGGTGVGRLALLIGLPFGFTLAMALPIGLFVTESILGPVRELIRGTDRVAAGDLETSIPVLSPDELGVLAASFNEMLEGLRDRESLRAHTRRQAEELRKSRSRIVAASDASRRQVERDLHDGAQQQLVLLNLKLGLLQRSYDEDVAAGNALVDEMRQDLARALAQLRDLAHGIYPALLESDGLPGALRDAAAGAALPVTIDCDSAGRYRPELEAAVYFCCLEALQNAAKHAGKGACATVRLAVRDRALRFEVSDDGRGFDLDESEPSSGLQNMTDRIGALGGELRISSSPGHGTTIAGSIPLEQG